MRFLKKFLAASPAAARVAPFVVFLALTFCQGKFGAASAYWFYFAKTLVGAWLIWEMRPFVVGNALGRSVGKRSSSASEFLRFGLGLIRIIRKSFDETGVRIREIRR